MILNANLLEHTVVVNSGRRIRVTCERSILVEIIQPQIIYSNIGRSMYSINDSTGQWVLLQRTWS